MWDESCAIGGAAARPRRSWRQRREAEEAAAANGLVQWQTNIYYGAGRVVVPALVDTFTIQAFAKRVNGGGAGVARPWDGTGRRRRACRVLPTLSHASRLCRVLTCTRASSPSSIQQPQ